jgi:hypothetical protein
MQQKQLLEDDAAACQKKMDSAAALLHALAGAKSIVCSASIVTMYVSLSSCCFFSSLGSCRKCLPRTVAGCEMCLVHHCR